METANLEVHKWLHDVANARTHGTTEAIPARRWAEEREALLPLALPENVTPLAQPRSSTPAPLQHPLGVYDALLQEGPS